MMYSVRRSHLSGASLRYATLVSTNLAGADLTGCGIHGVSAWGLKLDGATKQQNLVITNPFESEVTIDPSVDRLIEVTEEKIVRPAEAKFNELLARRTKQLRIETV